MSTGVNLICSLHGWDYVYMTGVSSYDNSDRLHRFSSWIEDGQIMVGRGRDSGPGRKSTPNPTDRDAYQGTYQDPHGTPAEPHVGLIRRLGNEGLDYLGHHGPVTSMGVSREELPTWDDIQFVTAQLARRPQLDDVAVATDIVIGAKATRPLHLGHTAVRVRHELWSIVVRGKSGARQGSRASRHRDLLW